VAIFLCLLFLLAEFLLDPKNKSHKNPAPRRRHPMPYGAPRSD
jgi:hypothetical protein